MSDWWTDAWSFWCVSDYNQTMRELAMRPPTAHCLDCQHRDLDEERGALTCRKGHKPRFYISDDWGWKRRCTDFESRVDIPPQAS